MCKVLGLVRALRTSLPFQKDANAEETKACNGWITNNPVSTRLYFKHPSCNTLWHLKHCLIENTPRGSMYTATMDLGP